MPCVCLRLAGNRTLARPSGTPQNLGHRPGQPRPGTAALDVAARMLAVSGIMLHCKRHPTTLTPCPRNLQKALGKTRRRRPRSDASSQRDRRRDELSIPVSSGEVGELSISLDDYVVYLREVTDKGDAVGLGTEFHPDVLILGGFDGHVAVGIQDHDSTHGSDSASKIGGWPERTLRIS